MLRPKNWPAVVAVLATTAGMSLAVPSEARADRCNPDELAGPAYTLVTGQPYEPVFGEDDGPFCYVMKTVVFPAIGCDPATQSLAQCVQAQPARARAIASGLCNETFSEVGDVYWTLPTRVRDMLREAFIVIGRNFSCD